MGGDHPETSTPDKSPPGHPTERLDEPTFVEGPGHDDPSTRAANTADTSTGFSVDSPGSTLLPGQWDSEGNSVASPADGSRTNDHGSPGSPPPLRPATPSEATIDIPPEFTATADGELASGTGFQSGGGGTTLRDNLPEFVGKYRVVRELGRGAFGVVYLAKDEDIDRDVAIKLSLVENAHYQERLMVEASKVAKVAGEHIVPVLHVDRTDFGAVYIVQRYIDGCTLSSLMQSDETITPGQAMILIYQLALGLKAAHKRDILHRDLKPDNILLDSEGVPWIVDFGIAISEDEQHERRRELAGTPPYMSPEQIMSRVDFMDARSDIWALGVIFYEVLTGKLPFTGRSRKELTEQICKRDPKPVQQYSPETLTDEMNTVFRKCCAKEPIDRFATVDELAAAMRGLIETYATVEDLEVPLGVNVKPGLISQTSTRAGLGVLATATERSTQFGRGNVTGQSVHESGRSNLTKIASAAAIAAVVVIGFVVRDYMRSGTVVESKKADDTQSTETLLDPQDASLIPYVAGTGPRRVAQSGLAHHRSIQAAIDAASAQGDDKTIEISPGFYHESVVITKPVTLTAAKIDQKPEILGGGDSALTVNCDGGTATITGLSFSAPAYVTNKAGIDAPAKFNVIDTKRGTLVMKECEVSKASFGAKDTYNGVHVDRDASVVIDDCSFLPTPGFAVVGIDHRQVVVTNSRFKGDGIQLLGGQGDVQSCEFRGERGVQVQKSGRDVVEISDCQFISNREWALMVTAGGNARSENNRYRGCNKGAWVGAQDEAMNMMGNAGELTMRSDAINECLVGVVVHGGAVAMESNCTIQGGRKAVFLSMGDFQASDLEITNCEDMAIHAVENTGDVMLEDVNIENCGVQGVTMESCESLELRSVQISNASESGLYVADGKTTVDSLTVRDAGIGVALMREMQPVRFNDIDVKGCRFGMYVAPTAGLDSEMKVTESRFEDCSKVAIYATAGASVQLSGVDFVGFEGRRPYLAKTPARIEMVRADAILETSDQP